MQLVNPPLVSQGTQSRCWCAALASLLQACGSPCYKLEALTNYAAASTKPKVVINGDGSLRLTSLANSEWTTVAGLFGMGVQYFWPAAHAPLPQLTPQVVRNHVATKKYTLLIFRDPSWAQGTNDFWHALVVYGVDDFDFFQVMDPDGGRYTTWSVDPAFHYLVSTKSTTEPWMMP